MNKLTEQEIGKIFNILSLNPCEIPDRLKNFLSLQMQKHVFSVNKKKKNVL